MVELFAPLPENDPAARYDEALDKWFSRREAALAPMWQAKNELIRTIITLSSSAIVITVSVVQFLATRQQARTQWHWMVGAAIISFAVAVLQGLWAYYLTAYAHTFRAFFEKERDILLMAIRMISTSTEPSVQAVRDAGRLGETIDTMITAALKRAEDKAPNAVKLQMRQIGFCYSFFALGLWLLVIFAIRNFPV